MLLSLGVADVRRQYMCARTQRTGAAACESLRRNNPWRAHVALRSTLVAAPVLFAHAVVTVANNK